MGDRIPPNESGQNYKGQMLGTDEDGYVRKVKVGSDGELLTSVDLDKSTRDGSMREAFNGLFGERFMASRKPTISANFSYQVDNRKILITETTGGSVDKVDNLLIISSGTNAVSEGSIQTKENLRYRAGRDAEMMATIRFDAPVVGNVRQYGLFDELDGFSIGYNELDFCMRIRKDGNDIFINNSEWIYDKLDGTGESGYNWKKDKMNLFRLCYGYLGVMTVTLEVYGGLENGWILCHAYEIANETESTHINLPYLPIRAENINNGNTTDVKMYGASTYCGTVDGAETFDSSSREFSESIEPTSFTAGTNKPIIVFHNKATYQGIRNKVNDLLLRVGLSADGTKPVLIRLYKLTAIPTGGTWVDVDTDNSNMEVNLGATIDLTNAELLIPWTLGKADSINDTDIEKLNLLLFPNEYAVITFTSTGSSEVIISNRWSEKF